jgi:hypothetical protein
MLRAVILITIIIMMSVMLFVLTPVVFMLFNVILGVNMFYVWSVRGCTTYTLIIIILSVAILIAFKMRVVVLFVTMPAVLILIIVILGVNMFMSRQ